MNLRLIHSMMGGLAACGLLLAGSGCDRPTAQAQAAAAASIDRVTAAYPQRKTLQYFTAQPARIEAFEETPLYPKVAGYVKTMHVDIGEAVKKDQVLVTLWVPELEDERRQKEALVAQAAAEVKQAEAAVKAAGAGVETAQASVNQAKAGIGRADAEVEFGDSVHRRIKDLVSRGSVTDQLSDEALYKLRAAEAARAEAAADVEAANAQVSQAQANAAKAQADLVAAQARHSVAQANLAQANTMLAYLEIKAPFDGVVSRREVDTGHYVHPASGGGSKPLLVVTRIDKVRIFVDVPEMEAPLVDSNVDGGASGDAAVVRVQSLRNREFDATVTRKSWSLDTSNRSLRTEIDIDNADGRLRPGMYATATILLDQRENAWALPITAIIRDGQQPYCCCVVSGKIERRSIELGLRCGEEVEVVSGLDGSQTVVLARAESLQQGQQVEVIEPQQ